jgi:DNA-binding NarL/FixJ family response regulator
MVVAVAGLLLWWWGAPRLMRAYALLSRRLLGAEAAAAVTARVRQQLAAQAARPKQSAALARLTPREREVLALVAEGRTNAAIAARRFITEKAVDKHLTSIFRKLDLPASAEDNRRVLAALAYHRQ